MIRELPHMGILFLTKLLYSTFRFKCVPKDWKTTKIMIIIKPGKNLERI